VEKRSKGASLLPERDVAGGDANGAVPGHLLNIEHDLVKHWLFEGTPYISSITGCRRMAVSRFAQLVGSDGGEGNITQAGETSVTC